MPKSIDSTLRSTVDAFVAELTTLINQAALETVQEALRGTAAPAKRGPGRPRKTASGGKTTRKKAKRAAKKSGKRVRRSIEDIKRTADKVLAYVKANPDKGVAEISKDTKVSPKDLKKPIIMLLDGKRIRTKGQKRGTTYFAGGDARKPKAPKKAAGKSKVKAGK